MALLASSYRHDPMHDLTRCDSRPLRGQPSTRNCTRTRSRQPFDPAELCRRLKIHERLQEEQEEQEERRRRPATEPEKDGQYHHRPRVAARGFTRTTSQDVDRSGQREAPGAQMPPTQEKKAVRRDRAGTSDRYSFPHSQHVENTSAAPGSTPQRRGFHLTSLLPPARRSPPRRPDRPYSMGDLSAERYLAEVIGHPAPPQPKPNNNDNKSNHQPPYQWGDRHDWTQRDECGPAEVKPSPFKDHHLLFNPSSIFSSSSLSKTEVSTGTAKVDGVTAAPPPALPSSGRPRRNSLLRFFWRGK